MTENGNYSDKEIKCAGCGAPFIFTVGEQRFYAEKGFTEEPKRCKDCRDKRKQQFAARRIRNDSPQSTQGTQR